MESLSPLEKIILIFLAVFILSIPQLWKYRTKPKVAAKMLKVWILMFAGTIAILILLYLGFTYLPMIIPVLAIFIILGGGFLTIIIAPFALKNKKSRG